MIVTRTPFRVSFFGGGTDFPDYFQQHGGAVLSTTINKYCYITCRWLPPFFDYKYRVRYAKREEINLIDEIQHPVVREGLRKLGVKRGIEMVHTSDIPAMSGIGSSSSFTVGFLHNMYALLGEMKTKRQLAKEAIEIEQQILMENVGSQDQVAASFGGLNKIEFNSKGFYVNPVILHKETEERLEKNLMLFFTGFTRFSSEVAKEQVKNIPARTSQLKTLKEMVDEAIKVLKKDDVDAFGRYLHEGWEIKKELSTAITSSKINDVYDAARSSGAIGGKILGAGGGGFLLLYVPEEFQESVKQNLHSLLHVPFNFESLGSQITMYSTIGANDAEFF